MSRREEAAAMPKVTAGRWGLNPTAEEIAEGKAWLAYSRVPNNRHLHEAHAKAFNALSRLPNYRLGSWRCQRCGVFVRGRIRGEACGSCGAILIGVEQRAASQIRKQADRQR